MFYWWSWNFSFILLYENKNRHYSRFAEVMPAYFATCLLFGSLRFALSSGVEW
jgi:hypothetical protein